MPRLFLLLFVWLAPLVASADSFDIVTYKLPAGWAAQKSNGSQVLATQVGQTFGAVTLMPSHASDGSLERDFKKTWDALAPGFAIKAAPKVTTQNAHGWDSMAGLATGTFNNASAQVILVQSTANGRTIGILVVSTLADMAPVMAFLDTIDLAKQDAPSAPAPSASTGGRSTTFGDGWTARIDAEFVEVTKGGMRVRLHYPVALDDQSRGDTVGFFWKKHIAGYRPTNVKIASYSAINFPYYFGTADVPNGYVALRIVIANGTAWPIEVFAPSRTEFERAFPDQDKLAAIQGANRFAVGADIAGTWTSFASGSVNMYYTGTGNFAGTQTAVNSTEYVFDKSGSYTSKNVGSSGIGAGNNIGVEKHKGTWSVSTWEITMKNEKGTSAWDAYYEAVRGGLVLHIQNKQYTGMAYALGRAK
ncbi:MAG: hypothetical protein QM831_16625 [Kofleriaceae bacterium]